jgi:hypothetical protein
MTPERLSRCCRQGVGEYVQEILYNQEHILQAIRVRYGHHHSPLKKVRIDSLGSYHSELGAAKA